jgi:hypothetical protein
MIKRKDKRGVGGLIFFVILLITIVVIGFAAAILSGAITWASDEITPVIKDIGMVEDVGNFSQAADYSVVPANNFVQAIPWLIGFSYVAMLLFAIFFAIGYQSNPNPFLIGLYIFLVVLVIFVAIIISNMYQDIYTGNDEIAAQLHEQQLMTFMILRSPIILTIIALIAGIFMFTRPTDVGGGYGV